MTSIQECVEKAGSGANPAVICRVRSGWAVLANMQHLRGYSLLLADPVVESLNSLDIRERAQYLDDMTLVGDALLEVTGAYRINYFIGGNSDPFLHAHIVPRYRSEPEKFRKGGPWSYPQETQDAGQFDAGRDQELMRQLERAIRKRL